MDTVRDLLAAQGAPERTTGHPIIICTLLTLMQNNLTKLLVQTEWKMTYDSARRPHRNRRDGRAVVNVRKTNVLHQNQSRTTNHQNKWGATQSVLRQKYGSLPALLVVKEHIPTSGVRR